MKKKILILLLMTLFMMSILVSNTFATISSSRCSLTTPKSQYNKGEEIVVTLRLDELKADKGIIAYSAV